MSLSFKNYLTERRAVLMTEASDPREHDFRISDRERNVLMNEVIKPGYTMAKRDYQEATKDEDRGDVTERDMAIFKETMRLYKRMAKIVQSGQPYGALVKFYTNLPSFMKEDVNFFLKRLTGPDAHAIRHRLMPSKNAK